MSHTLYAKIDGDERQAYTEAENFLEVQDIDGYPYRESPHMGAKVIRDSDWLPTYLVEAVYQEFTPEQAVMYGDALMKKCGGYIPQGDREKQEFRTVIEIATWLQYWGFNGVAVEGTA